MIAETLLTDGFITIKPQSLDYLDQLFEAAIESSEALFPWMAWMHADYAIEEPRKYLERCVDNWSKEIDFQFAIFDADETIFLGGCGLNQIHGANFANLGYWVRTSRTKQGVATAATRLVARFGFEQVKLDRAEIVVAVGNKASQRVAVKAGATREGILRNRLKVRDALHDAVMFSLIPGDIEDKKPRNE